MKIRYRISPADFQEAQKLMRSRLLFPFWHTLFKWGARAGFVAVASFLIYAGLTKMPGVFNLGSNTTFFLILLALYIFVLPVVLRVQAARAYRRDPALHREISVDLNEDRYEADDGAGARTSMTWDYYDRFVEGKRVFVLRRPSRIFTIISKSGMRAGDLTEFRELLTRCVVRR